MAKATDKSGGLFTKRIAGDVGGAAMRLSWDEIHSKAVAFSKRWEDSHREKADAQPFITEFLEVFGVDDAVKKGEREKPVKISGSHDKYIDFFWKDHIAIEMKSRDKDRAKSGESVRKRKLEGAYEQLKWYMEHIPDEDVPDLWMVCDFETFKLWRRSTSETFTFTLKDFRKHIRRFADIAGYTAERMRDEQVEINVRGAGKMAILHDALKERGYEGHELEVYLVRLLFCLFAGDAGIFPSDKFFQYLYRSKEDGSDLSERIGKLFEVLDMSPETRDKRTLLTDELKQFRYINGKLFASILPTAEFDKTMRNILIGCAQFDWQNISPAIFGAMFQGVMDKTRRRELGAHYTSEENILKLINPLFMDDLWSEFDRVKADPIALDHFHDKIGSLKFLDPACGCGNFLIVTYRELRKLELEILRMKIGTGKVPDIKSILKVGVERFYGIEYEDFPCQIAQTGMWLADHQMNMLVSEEFGEYFARLPLTASATIRHGNALQIDWKSVVPEPDYIIGNPPFSGARFMAPTQKEDMQAVFEDMPGVGNLDYVTAWYKKAADMMAGTQIRTAFVSTNSVSQGEQVALLWEPLFLDQNVHIDFGHRTFKWSNAAPGQAAVHCVIIGFSIASSDRPRRIFDAEQVSGAKHINAYLVDAPDVFVHSRQKPICDVPGIGIGNKPIDDGNYLFTEEEKVDFLAKEPKAEKWFRPWLGSHEFINRYFRYCLWLGDCSPAELRSMPEAMKRVDAVRRFRLQSRSAGTRKLANTPTHFHVENMPESNYLVIPQVSSERRHYIPIGFLTHDILCSDKLRLMPDAELYHFGILTSSVHNAWMRAVCCRLKSDYSYSNDIVYNNFPWPETTDEQKTAIEKLAQRILDARALFPDSSLADLYDPLTMPPELLKAHQALDRAVMKLYSFSQGTAEPAIVAALMERYQRLATRLD